MKKEQSKQAQAERVTQGQEVSYSAIGIVYGSMYGGGNGAYEARKLKDYLSKEVLIAEAKHGLKNKSLDSGFGFETLIGAVLFITKQTVLFIDGKRFVNEEREDVVIGKLTDLQSAHCYDTYFRS